MVFKPSLLLFVVYALCACGVDEEVTLAIRVISPTGPSDSLRRFPPNSPLPERIQVTVLRSDDLSGKPVAEVDEAWDDLAEDPNTDKKYLLVTVKSNQDKQYTYLLRLASVHSGQVDECGAIGQIQAARGAKVRLSLVTHTGNCSQVLCQSDADCPGDRYCLSFECQDSEMCGNCPPGAYCDQDSDSCAGACGSGADPCEDSYACCSGMCSTHCPPLP